MKPGKPQSIKSLLKNPGSALARVADDAAAHERLSRQVRGLLPPDLATHVLSVNLRDETLVIITDSAAWATRIRYQQGDIMQNLATQHGVIANKLVTKVRPGR
jgi:hypothetical protein